VAGRDRLGGCYRVQHFDAFTGKPATESGGVTTFTGDALNLTAHELKAGLLILNDDPVPFFKIC
jgi:hypothetical protein